MCVTRDIHNSHDFGTHKLTFLYSFFACLENGFSLKRYASRVYFTLICAFAHSAGEQKRRDDCITAHNFYHYYTELNRIDYYINE